MSYQQATIAVTEHIAERLSDALMEHGALSAAIEDAYAGTNDEQAIFGEPGMPTEQLWLQSKVIALFAEETDINPIIIAAAAQTGIDVPAYSVELLPEQDWVRLTQSQFDPIKISERLWITPSWHEAPDAGAVNLQLDPGLAFGTGSHPTTHLCLQWLDRNLKGGESLLDYGCGSGILAIAALKLGAGSATGVDIDPQAIRASNDNAAQNQVPANFHLPDALPAHQGPLAALLPALQRAQQHGHRGLYVLEPAGTGGPAHLRRNHHRDPRGLRRLRQPHPNKSAEPQSPNKSKQR